MALDLFTPNKRKKIDSYSQYSNNQLQSQLNFEENYDTLDEQLFEIENAKEENRVESERLAQIEQILSLREKELNEKEFSLEEKEFEIEEEKENLRKFALELNSTVSDIDIKNKELVEKEKQLLERERIQEKVYNEKKKKLFDFEMSLKKKEHELKLRELDSLLDSNKFAMNNNNGNGNNNINGNGYSTINTVVEDEQQSQQQQQQQLQPNTTTSSIPKKIVARKSLLSNSKLVHSSPAKRLIRRSIIPSASNGLKSNLGSLKENNPNNSSSNLVQTKIRRPSILPNNIN
ncbi:hypothetical protein CYY_003739 [Polysphondylium violaceum]|uniref:Uncharacterized protein n=1 Tax=Polysphondylium violaceum TaxID=133409 RepID=A0A8J4V8E4_9MYCE|nr:hypothetical protein CYY_003739 [Polysphondylium violaceum]